MLKKMGIFVPANKRPRAAVCSMARAWLPKTASISDPPYQAHLRKHERMLTSWDERWMTPVYTKTEERDTVYRVTHAGPDNSITTPSQRAPRKPLWRQTFGTPILSHFRACLETIILLTLFALNWINKNVKKLLSNPYKYVMLASTKADVDNECRHSVQITHGVMVVVTHDAIVILERHGGREGKGRVASLHLPPHWLWRYAYGSARAGCLPLPGLSAPYTIITITIDLHFPLVECGGARREARGAGHRFIPFSRTVEKRDKRCGLRGRLRRFLDSTLRENQAMTIRLIHYRFFLWVILHTREHVESTREGVACIFA